jgi:hypothetical protein
MSEDWTFQRTGVVQRRSQKVRIGNVLAVIAESDSSGFSELCQRR